MAGDGSQDWRAGRLDAPLCRGDTTRYGDLLLRFFDDDFFPGQTNDVETHTARVGARHELSPISTLLFNAFYQHADTSQVDKQYPVPPVRLVELRLPDNAYGSELQHLYRLPGFRLTSGAGYFHTYGDLGALIGLDLPPPPDGPGSVDITSKTPAKVRHANAYGYGNVELVPELNVTLGASYDSLSGDFPGEETSKYKPKFGVIWNPLPATTIRGAAFKTLKRTLITNQTLEPTQVAGFNQFFDDYSLTEATAYGAALDQKFGREIFGGVEFFRRNLKVPFIGFSADTGLPTDAQADWNERLSRAYLFWTPHPWWALKMEYSYQRANHDVEFPEGFTRLDTRQLGFGVSFFHPSGFSATVRTSRVDQDGDFTGVSNVDFRSGSDRFWLTDAAVNYRLPARRGFLSVGATHLFDQHFNYFDIDLNNASIQPDRMVFFKMTLALP